MITTDNRTIFVSPTHFPTKVNASVTLIQDSFHFYFTVFQDLDTDDLRCTSKGHSSQCLKLAFKEPLSMYCKHSMRYGIVSPMVNGQVL